MAKEARFVRTQEKQYNAWLSGGVKIPGDVQSDFVLCTAEGVFQPVTFQDVAVKFRFATGEPITQQAVKAKMINGALPWTEVKRVTDAATLAPIWAQHIPGRQCGGLGVFNVCPEINGQPAYQFRQTMRGDVFVRTYNLASFKGIATREQQAAAIAKPKELEPLRVAPAAAASLKQNKVPVTAGSASLESQIRQAAELLRKANGASVKVAPVKNEQDGQGRELLKGGIDFKFSLTGEKAKAFGELTFVISAMKAAPEKVVYKAFIKGEGYGVAPPPKQGAELSGLVASLSAYGMEQAGAIIAAYNLKKTQDQLHAMGEHICNALSGKVLVLKHVKDSTGTMRVISPKYPNAMFEGVQCTLSIVDSDNYSYKFEEATPGGKAMSPAAKALASGIIPVTETKPDAKLIVAAVVKGWANLAKAGAAAKGIKTDKNIEYRVLGYNKGPNGEKLYVVEKLDTGAKTTMTRNQLLQILGWDGQALKQVAPNRVENMRARKYQNTTQLRMKDGGQLPLIPIDNIRRSSINREAGDKAETLQLYAEVMRNLAKRGFKPDGDIEVDGDPLYGFFKFITPEGRNLQSMYSVVAWKYGVTDGGAVALQATMPDGSRRRSMLASSLVSMILAASKSAAVAEHKPSAPIVQAEDDDFSGVEEFFDDMEEADMGDGGAGVPGTDASGSVTAEVVTAEATQDTGDESADDALDSVFDELEEAPADTAAQEAAEREAAERAEAEKQRKLVESASSAYAKAQAAYEDITSNLGYAEDSSDSVQVSLNAYNKKRGGFDNLSAEFNSVAGGIDDSAKLADGSTVKGARESLAAYASTLDDTKAQMDKALAKAKEAEAEAAAKAAEAEAAAKAAKAAASDEDPFGDLGDDIDTIFNNIEGELISAGE